MKNTMTTFLFNKDADCILKIENCENVEKTIGELCAKMEKEITPQVFPMLESTIVTKDIASPEYTITGKFVFVKNYLPTGYAFIIQHVFNKNFSNEHLDLIVSSS